MISADDPGRLLSAPNTAEAAVPEVDCPGLLGFLAIEMRSSIDGRASLYVLNFPVSGSRGMMAQILSVMDGRFPEPVVAFPPLPGSNSLSWGLPLRSLLSQVEEWVDVPMPFSVEVVA